ncbi:hypothetical protein BDA99DRAFT_520034 [Phascolomyces articulosus]|uniref:protein-tyrosine-phosphatase n=1 Tax=Phascolomyces articulosus TaxID=60185 RepID=A0AAD5PAF8_9FUNG|nr:hypothetical protein BDA99DRAFT_520034 [Phascolomyces articulosus]
MTAPLATSSTPVLTSLSPQQRPFSFSPSASSSGLASRRRNNKNLSLCLSDSTRLVSAPATPNRMQFDLTPNKPTPPQPQGPYQHGPLRIMPHLYLGAEHNALDMQHLRRLSIDCMLNVAEEVVHPQERQFISFDDMFDDRLAPPPSAASSASNSVLPSPSLSRASTASSIASSLHTIEQQQQQHYRPSSPTARWFNENAPALLFPGSKKKKRQASVSSIGSMCDTYYNNNINVTTPHTTNNNTMMMNNSNRLATLNTLCEKQNMAYKKIPWIHNQENLVNELDGAIAAIDQARDAGHTILVHCQCGVARSATVIIAYIMKTMKLPMQEAYDYVKAQAPGISPNLALLYQLREYEQKLSHLNSDKSTTTTTMLRSSNQHSPKMTTTHTNIKTTNKTNNNNSKKLSLSSASLRPSNLYDRSYHHPQSPVVAATQQPTSPKTPCSPKKPLFLFRKSSLSLSWKRRMGKLKPEDGQPQPTTPTTPTSRRTSTTTTTSDFESWWKSKMKQQQLQQASISSTSQGNNNGSKVSLRC